MKNVTLQLVALTVCLVLYNNSYAQRAICNSPIVDETVKEFASMGVDIDFYACPKDFNEALAITNDLDPYALKLWHITSNLDGLKEAIAVFKLVNKMKILGRSNGFRVHQLCDYGLRCPTTGYRESQTKKLKRTFS